MKTTLRVILMILGVWTVLTAQDAIDVKGAWEMTIETPQDAMPISLTVSKVEGEAISGTLSSPQGELAVTGKLHGADVNFAATFEGNGRSLTLTFTGKVTKEGMSGSVDFGGMGQGNWSAKRPG